MQPTLTLIAAAAFALVWLFLRRANELCTLEIAEGRSTLLRGRAPGRFLSDVRDIAARSSDERLVIAVVSEGGLPRVVVRSGAPRDHILQQLRNVAGQHRVHHFRTGVERG